MSDGDFAERMKRVPNEELFYVISSEGFQPDAVAAAQLEIARRGIAADETAQYQTDIEERRIEDEDRPNRPLSVAGKLAFLFFGPIMLLTLPALFVLNYRGYRQKRVDGLTFMLLGFAMYGTISFILSSPWR